MVILQRVSEEEEKKEEEEQSQRTEGGSASFTLSTCPSKGWCFCTMSS